MLLVLDESVAGVLHSSGLSSATRHAFDYLMICAWEGKHRLTGNIRLLQTLKRLPSLDYRALAVLDSAISTISDDMRLRGSLKVLGLVKSTTIPIPVCVQNGNTRQIEFPLLWFDDSEKIQATCIAGENLTDARLAEFIANTIRCILSRNGEMRPPIKARLQPGGGNTTADLVGRLASTQMLCLCLVDSDREFPSGPLGETASRVFEYNDPARYPLTEIWATPGREFENYLPNEFFRRVYHLDANHARSILAITGLSSSGEHDARGHLDIKNGLVLETLFDFAERTPGRLFWEDKIQVIGNILAIQLHSFQCYQSKLCVLSGRCTCRMINGHADNLLERFLEAFRWTSPYEIDRMLDSSVRGVWMEIAETVTAWCCAKDRIRS